MKHLTPLFAGFIAMTLSNALGADAPRGSLLEIHSCEVYAGPCVISAESPQEGRYMVRAWDFNGGSFSGADLTGLQLAVLQSSPDNLAETGSRTGDAVVYLPQSATQNQRDALLAWVKSQSDFHPARTETRVVPLQFTKSDTGYTFTAGKFVSVQTAPLEQCKMGGCGETLWYQPRAANSIFTVVLNNGSKVAEPMLKLTWNATGNRDIFLARFGEAVPAKDLYVSLQELCGPTGALF